jgi:hypothetical protein
MNTTDLNNQKTEQHATPASTRYRRQFVRNAMEGFHKNFAPESRPVYVSGIGGAHDTIDEAVFDRLGIDTDHERGKWPNVIFYCAKRGWLFLLDPITGRHAFEDDRLRELHRLLHQPKAEIVYVLAFKTRRVMGWNLSKIPWGAHAWAADEPTHLVHFNGTQLMKPHVCITGDNRPEAR